MKWKVSFMNLINEDQLIGVVQKAAYVYLALPILIFVVFWLKPVYGLPAVLLILMALIRICRKHEQKQICKIDQEDIKKLVVCMFLICIWVYFSGIGRFVYQNDDHAWRNTIFRTLVQEHWPVIGRDETIGFERPVAFIYYFAFWLPAALVGKLTTVNIGFYVQAVWAVIGIFLAFVLFCEIRRKVRVWYLVLFIFFSGLDIVGTYILNTDTRILTSSHLEWWAGMQYSCFTTQLFWVFNQSIPAWLITALMLVQKDRHTLVFIYSFSIFSCTFPAVGMIPILICQMISCGYDQKIGKKENFRKFIKESCTYENIFCAGIIGTVSYLFLRNNSSGQLQEMSYFNLTSYMMFLFLEVGIYFIFIYRYCSRSGLYYVCMLTLTAIPFVQVGIGGDFCMRASIPAIVVLYLFVLEALEGSFFKREYHIFAMLVAVILIGSITPVHEWIRTLQNTVSGDLNQSEAVLYSGTMPNNFYGYADDSFFFKYLASD